MFKRSRCKNARMCIRRTLTHIHTRACALTQTYNKARNLIGTRTPHPQTHPHAHTHTTAHTRTHPHTPTNTHAHPTPTPTNTYTHTPTPPHTHVHNHYTHRYTRHINYNTEHPWENHLNLTLLTYYNCHGCCIA